MKKIVVQTSEQERFNNEYQHTSSLNASTEKKRVKAQDMHSTDLTWWCDTLHAADKNLYSFDCERQENMRKRDNLCLPSVLAVYDSSSA